jgi:hypothetical protein
LKNFLKKMVGAPDERDTFYPSELGDPVAMQTDWTPATSGGTTFRTHKLVESNPDQLEFRASTGLKLFYLIFLVVGVGALIAFFCIISFGGRQVNWGTLCLLGVGITFPTAGARLLYIRTAPIVFDRRRGFFWIGRKNPEHVFNKGTLKHFAELEQIHALQLISKLVVTGSQLDYSRYFSYELNLVLEDGKRINVLSQGDQDSLREDAETLAAFLDKPIWDAT